jgi:hypothetical protein
VRSAVTECDADAAPASGAALNGAVPAWLESKARRSSEGSFITGKRSDVRMGCGVTGFVGQRMGCLRIESGVDFLVERWERGIEVLFKELKIRNPLARPERIGMQDTDVAYVAGSGG